MIVAVLFMSFILLIVPLTILAKPLLGLEKVEHLLLSRGLGLWHHYSLLKVAEEALDGRGVVRIWPREHGRHPESVDLLDCLLLGVVPGIIHKDSGIHPPGRALSVK